MSEKEFIEYAKSKLKSYGHMLASGETYDFANEFDEEEGLSIISVLEEFENK
jgi:hypothetical protein